ncbi:MAG: signal peptide prediction, partial [Ensifer adhaerens]
MSKHQPDQATTATPSLHLSGRPRLRVLGTAISLLEELRVRAEADLGIDVVFDNNDFLTTQHKAAQEPDSYDIYDQCFH